jgi:hypothetical protein
MNPEQEIRRSADARFILSHDLYKEAWNATADALTQQRRKVALKDTDMHTRLIMAEQVLDSVRRYIEDVVNTGKMAEIQLKRPGSAHRWLGIGQG